MDSFDTYILITAIVSMVILLISWVRMRIRFQKNPFLRLGIISAVAFDIFFLIIGILYILEIETELLPERLALIIICCIYFFGYLFYEGFLSIKPPLWRLLLMFSFAAFAIGLIILTIIGRYDGRNLFFYTFLIGSAFSIFGMRVTRKTQKMTNHPGLKIDLLALFILLVGNMCAQIIGLLRFYANVQYEDQIFQILFIFATGLIISSLITLGINSYFHGDYIHLMPVKIYTILIYNQGGLLVYNRSVSGQEETKLKKGSESLISGALMAFSTFFKEILGTKAKLSYIDAEEYEFLFSSLPQDTGTCVLIVSQANYYLKRFLKTLSRDIPKEFLDSINKKDGYQMRKDELIDIHLKKSIPYINF